MVTISHQAPPGFSSAHLQHVSQLISHLSIPSVTHIHLGWTGQVIIRVDSRLCPANERRRCKVYQVCVIYDSYQHIFYSPDIQILHFSNETDYEDYRKKTLQNPLAQLAVLFIPAYQGNGVCHPLACLWGIDLVWDITSQYFRCPKLRCIIVQTTIKPLI